MAKQFAQSRHLQLQVVFFHDQPGPHHFKQLILGDDAVAVNHQRLQNIECTGTERHRLAIDQQRAFAEANFDVSKTVSARHGSSLGGT